MPQYCPENHQLPIMRGAHSSRSCDTCHIIYHIDELHQFDWTILLVDPKPIIDIFMPLRWETGYTGNPLTEKDFDDALVAIYNQKWH